MANNTSYGLKEQLNSPMINVRLNVFHIKPLKDRYIYMEVKFAPSQRRVEICSEFFKEEY